MANVDGVWDCVVRTPLGDQRGALRVASAGFSFTGSMSGDLGAIDITDGEVAGDTLRWTMSVTSPMPLSLECEATATGDALEGNVTAGAFGAFPLSGRRAD